MFSQKFFLKPLWVTIFCLVTCIASAEDDSIEILGFKDDLQSAVTDTFSGANSPGFPDNVFINGAIDNIGRAIGSDGALAKYVDGSGVYQGTSVSGSVTYAANIELNGEIASTSLGWQASISWETVAGPDGHAHIKITVTWGEASNRVSRVLDKTLIFTNDILNTIGQPIPTVYVEDGWGERDGVLAYGFTWTTTMEIIDNVRGKVTASEPVVVPDEETTPTNIWYLFEWLFDDDRRWDT